MKFTTSEHLNNWYGITANAGDTIDVPENLIRKAEATKFLTKAKKRAKNID